MTVLARRRIDKIQEYIRDLRMLAAYPNSLEIAQDRARLLREEAEALERQLNSGEHL